VICGKEVNACTVQKIHKYRTVEKHEENVAGGKRSQMMAAAASGCVEKEGYPHHVAELERGRLCKVATSCSPSSSRIVHEFKGVRLW
jgi:hypothetical protein